MNLTIAPDLIQHYFLDVEPRSLDSVVGELERSSRAGDDGRNDATPWSLFFWLDRPALWAIRPVGVTSGLDAFLIQGQGMPGLTDVAEMMTQAFTDEQTSGVVANSWTEFVKDFPREGLIFASFLWLDWEAADELGKRLPGATVRSSEVLAAFRRSLATCFGGASKEAAKPIRLLLTGCTGDADLVLYGMVGHISELDRCLDLVNQQMWSSLAPHLGLNAEHAAVGGRQVIARSRTELAINVDLYRQFRGRPDDLGALIERVNAQLGVNLIPETALVREGGAITGVHDRITSVIGSQWMDQPVFGRDDFVVRLAPGGKTECGFGELLALHARLDGARIEDAGFPKRCSLRLGFSPPLGLAGSSNRANDSAEPARCKEEDFDQPTLEAFYEMVRSLSALKWREDLRIIERVAERCITLRKSSPLPRETRRMLQVAFRRFGEICRRIQECERNYSALTAELHAPGNEKPLKSLVNDIQFRREELYYSGASLDRVLTHHSRGVAALLLHPTSSARGSSHFCSEISLSNAIGIVFRAPTVRLRNRIGSGDCPEIFENSRRKLCERLGTISEPIIYASHEPGFCIRPGLTLLRVPTWGLWQPTTHPLHELGHAFADVGAFHYLAKKVLSRGGGGDRCLCPAFERRMSELGLCIPSPGTWDDSAVLAEIAADYFERRSVPPGHEYPLAKTERKRQLEEIVADLIERLLGYPAGEIGDREHLWNALPTIAPYAVRAHKNLIRDRIFQLFAAQLAVRYADNDPSLLLANAGAPIRTEMAADHAVRFLKWIDQWFREFSSKGMSALPDRFVCKMVGHVASACTTLNADLRSLLRQNALRAHLLGTIISIGPLVGTNIELLFKATSVWGGLLPLAREADAGTPDAEALANELAEGIVPDRSFQFPERVVSALVKKFRRGSQGEIPPCARFALSRFLGDHMWE